MEQYIVTGMSCAACSARVEKAVQSVDGVTICSVSLLTNQMTVEGTANADDIILAVEKAGYKAFKKDDGASFAINSSDTLTDKETPLLLKRLISSFVFLILLMYLSMGHTMWGFPLPERLENNPLLIGILQMILSLTVMGINY